MSSDRASKNLILPRTQIAHYYSVNGQLSTRLNNIGASCRPVGLQNLGSTCWFNVVIQLLYHIPKFRQAVLQCENLSTHSSQNVISVLQDLFITISFSEQKQINPIKAVESIGKLLENGIGQQDASEYLAILLERISSVIPEAVENLFYGTINNDKFLQHSIQVNSNYTLLSSIESSLTFPQKQLFTHLPPIFLVNISRLIQGDSPCELVKDNHILSFSSVIFMDRFTAENEEQVSDISILVENYKSQRNDYCSKIDSLQLLSGQVAELKTVYDAYQSDVVGTSVDFDVLCSTNLQWEEEIRSKILVLKKNVGVIDEKLRTMKSRAFSAVRPYQLHAVLVHRGQSDGGHYWIYVWNSTHQTWFHINDNLSQQVDWDSVTDVAFGGQEHDSSAHILIYIDSLKAQSLLDMKEEYDVGYDDVLCYLKDPTDVRTRHASYGKSQTFKAVHGVISSKEQEASFLLYQALDNERRRLYSILDEWVDQPVDDEVRLRHFAVYLLANQVSFEPYVYWTLLQHFSIFALQAQKRTNGVCLAARHALAFLENSVSLSQKRIFIQWNTSYHQFLLIVRHLMASFTHVFTQNFSAAVPLALKALYLHHDLMSSALRGPAMSVKPHIIPSLVETSLVSLSNSLLLSDDLSAVGDIACAVLFDGLIHWCEYTDESNIEAARSTSRCIVQQWKKRMTTWNVSLDSVVALAETRWKLAKVESTLNELDFSGKEKQRGKFEFKGHIPENMEDGDKLAEKWKQVWDTVSEKKNFVIRFWS